MSRMVIDRLEELLTHDKLRYILGKEARVQVEFLRKELAQIKALLAADGDKHRLVDKTIHDSWLAQIRDVAYEAEDLIESYFVESQRTKGLSYTIFRSSSAHKVAKDLSKLREKIKHLKELGQFYDSRKKGFSEEEKGGFTNSQIKATRHRNSTGNSNSNSNSNSVMVGREEETKKLLNLILDESGPSRICIVGQGGIGKTTLARKIYENDTIRGEFRAAAWVHVDQNFQSANLLRKILEQLEPDIKAEELKSFTKLEMCEKIFDFQRTVKCLLVLDDVWSQEFWESIRIAFPSGKIKSKLLFTSRDASLPHQMKSDEFLIRPLTYQDSWKLFKNNASLDDVAQDKQIYETAKEAVRLCCGSPLSITVLGRLLASKNSPSEWKIILDALKNSYDDGLPKELRVLSLSYDDLSEHLKLCFLYMGIFPEDSIIEVEGLYQLWIAEGFISYESKETELTMMDIAEQYLHTLVTRCLVEVQEAEVPNVRQFKSCHLHDLVWELCLRKGKEESFSTSTGLIQNGKPESLYISSNLQYGKETNLPPYSYPSNGKPCRLAVCLKKFENTSNCSVDFKTFRYMRSILAFNVYKSGETLMPLPESFKIRVLSLLRVLKFDGFDFHGTRSLKELQKLGFLRYLSFRECRLEELPSSIGELSNLQTLDLRVRATSVAIPNVLWKLTKLRHLYLPPVYHAFEDDTLRLDCLNDLETLKNFDTTVCNAVDLLFLTNLRVLEVTTEGNFQDLESIIKCINMPSSYLCQSSLYIKKFCIYPDERNIALRKLFESENLHTLHINGRIGTLPNTTSTSLTQIVLKDSEIVQDPMPTLEKFPNLWVLDLENQAFLGNQMVCSAVGFPQLRILKISNLTNLECLKIHPGAMPNLSSLTVEGCKNLEDIPELGAMPKLSTLTLKECKWLETNSWIRSYKAFNMDTDNERPEAD